MSNERDRNYNSFVNLGGSDWARRTTNIGGSVLSGINYDSANVTYPNTVTEVYEFKNGGLSGPTVAIVTVVYTNSTKENILSFERT